MSHSNPFRARVSLRPIPAVVMLLGAFAGLGCSSADRSPDDETSADEAELRVTCAAVRCGSGTHCSTRTVDGARLATCVADPPPTGCATVRCAPGTSCEVATVAGKKVAQCVKTSGCAAVRCTSGHTCEDRNVDGRLSAVCVPTGVTCAAVRCAPGFSCTDEWVDAKKVAVCAPIR